MLMGNLQNKEILNYLTQLKSKNIRNIKWSISSIFEKFNTNCRSEIIQKCKNNSFDSFFPLSLFDPGVYNFQLELQH